MLFAGVLFVAAIPFGAIVGMLVIRLPLSHLARSERLQKVITCLAAVTGIVLMWWMLADIVRGWGASSGASPPEYR